MFGECAVAVPAKSQHQELSPLSLRRKKTNLTVRASAHVSLPQTQVILASWPAEVANWPFYGNRSGNDE
jgi:hypothetical protein